MPAYISQKAFLYAVKDALGNVEVEVVASRYDTVILGSLINDKGESWSYEGDGRHLEEWCQEKGLQFHGQPVVVRVPDPFTKENE